MPVVLLLGGARSGKSRLAVQLAERGSASVTVIATAEARDDEMTARIARHREERPRTWTTVEEPLDVSEAMNAVPADDVVVLDCVTMWVSNLMEGEIDDDALLERVRRAAELAAGRRGLVVVVSNEVGSGVIPGTPLGRRFGDVLGRANAAWADVAERSVLVVAGKVLTLNDAAELWP